MANSGSRKPRRGNRFNFLQSLLAGETGAGRRQSKRQQHWDGVARRTRPKVEALEPRLMLAVDVSLSNGNLLVQEISTGNDALEIGFDTQSGSYVISDQTQSLTTGISGAEGDGTKTVVVPASLVTGDINVLTGGGDDVVSVLDTFGEVVDRAVVLDLGDGVDSVSWSASSGVIGVGSELALTGLSVTAESTSLNVPQVLTSGEQTWATSLQLSIATTLIGSGISLQDIDLGQKDLFVNSSGSISLVGAITNGGSGEITLEAASGITMVDSSLVTNAGSISVTTNHGTLQVVGSELVSGSGQVSLSGTSHDSDGLVIRNSSVETSANGEIFLTGVGGLGQDGIVIEGSANANASITTAQGDITLTGTAGPGAGNGILMSYGTLNSNNGSQLLTGRSSQASSAGVLLENSQLSVTGNGDISFVSGTSEVIFGSGDNQFGIEFARVGDLGNVADTTGAPNPAGSVEYAYQMGRYEISRDMINKANADASLGITLHDMSQNGGNGASRPATGIDWFEAAQLVNWLNTSEGYSEAYKFLDGTFVPWTSADEGYDSTNPFRNSNAKYVIPSMDEWYKAAYFDPATGLYYDFATGSDETPTSVTGGTDSGTAVYGLAESQGPSDIANAGGLSPYGIMAMSGNVWEWVETAYDQVNSLSDEDRFIRGGAFWTARSAVGSLKSDDAFPYDPSINHLSSGFRVASLFEEVSGLVQLDGSTISVTSGSLDIDASLTAIESTLNTTTGAMIIGGGESSILAMSTTITSDSGAIAIYGDGARDGVVGIDLVNTQVNTGGAGTLSLSGGGGPGYAGVVLETTGETGTSLSTQDGLLTVLGTGGLNGGDGIQLIGGSITTTGSGNVQIVGEIDAANAVAVLVESGEVSATATGSLLFVGTSLEFADATIAVSTGELQTETSSLTLTGDSTLDINTDLSLQISLDGDGNLTKTGSGTLTVAVDSSVTGTLSVTEGLLLVNATHAGGVTVDTGGTLGGTGTILGAVLTTGSGVIDPGDVLGTSTSQLTTGNLEL
ncbi:MAG: SUMF1/EgtB/PvdO family nonheme iron enzyme, partial [Rubripirellula sp.]|nr:SUMF1/EgtB/PvdO family nonheme iron enzyme [Rubripirellula sp.]